MPMLLAQSAPNTDVSRIVLVVGVLLVAVLVLAGVVLKMRRRLLASEDIAGDALTLHDLRTLHARGNLTDEEFEKAKSALIGVASRPPNRAGPDAITRAKPTTAAHDPAQGHAGP